MSTKNTASRPAVARGESRDVSRRVCVLRSVAGLDQYVPAESASDLKEGETMFIADFRTFQVKDGPSGSHLRSCCEPVGEVKKTRATACVIREVARGDAQYVPVSEVPQLKRGETVYTGLFTGQREACGPSGSHVRTICLPAGPVVESRAQVKYRKRIA